MTIYTSEDFETFERINDTILCPTGDYSNIKKFGDNCKFGNNCKFGSNSEFGKNCNFGERCNFENNCSFGGWCSFGEWCSFSSNSKFRKICEFGDNCEFKDECSFGERNNFGQYCRFGGSCDFKECCKFGERCYFKEYCAFENNGVAKTTTPFITINAGSVNRTSYAFNLESGIFIRSGCFFGTLEQFEDEVILTHGYNSIHGRTYLAWVEIVKINFGEV